MALFSDTDILHKDGPVKSVRCAGSRLEAGGAPQITVRAPALPVECCVINAPLTDSLSPHSKTIAGDPVIHPVTLLIPQFAHSLC